MRSRAAPLVALGLLALLVFLASLAACHHVVPMNSDNATLVLEGQSMARGDIGLHGWALPLDSFWMSEAPLYAIAIALVGLRAELLYVVPAAIAAAAVLIGMRLALAVGRPPKALVGPAVVFALLALPSPALSFFFLQGAWHVGSALLCLVAFAAVCSSRRGAPFVAVLALSAALLGDLQTALLGIAPVLLAGVVSAIGARSLRASARFLAVALGAPLLSLGVLATARALGSFQIVNPNPTARYSELLRNLAHLPAREAGLFGVVAMPVSSPTGEPLALHVLHGLAFGLVLLAVLAALGGIAAALGGGRVRASKSRGWRLVFATGPLDDLLVFGVVCDLVDFVVLSATGNGNYARYLTASVVFAAVLAGRAVSRTTGGPLGRRPAAALAALGVILLVALAAAFAWSFSLPAAPDKSAALRSFLIDHGLREGVGDYWSSSIVTVDSGGALQVRPVIEAPSGQLVRYGRQSAAQWYSGQRFTFFVYDTALLWRGVDAASAEATFGTPTRTYAVGSYRVLVYPHHFSISPVGYTRGTPSEIAAAQPR